MKITLNLALSAALLFVSCSKGGAAEKPVALVTGPRDANAAELAVLAPLVKGSKLFEYEVSDIKMTPSEGLAVALVKSGGFLPDGGPTDGGSCDPSQRDEARAYLTLWLANDAGSPSLVRGPYAIFTRPINMPQAEVDRLALALADIVNANVNVPVPPSLASGNQQPQTK